MERFLSGCARSPLIPIAPSVDGHSPVTDNDRNVDRALMSIPSFVIGHKRTVRSPWAYLFNTIRREMQSGNAIR